MHLRPQSLLLLGALASLAWLLPTPTCRAQEAGAKVRFVTIDSVEIVGTFYPGGKKDACVMLLHPIGKTEDSHKAGWDSLAKTLNKEGYAVLSFDFRGHGDSTKVDPAKFWSPMFTANRAYVKPNRSAPDEITVEQFKAEYYPSLVNDIAAAKGFLDRKNDAGACNTSALIVIGAETGATLGGIWMNSEWFRYRYTPAVFPQVQGRLAAEPEGKGTIAAIFLSISPKLGLRTLSLEKLLSIPGRVHSVPMVFMYGQGDNKGKAEAKRLEKFLKGKQQFTGAFEVQGAGDLKGRKLLESSLHADQLMIQYMDKVLENKTPERITREYQKSQYVWAFPNPGRLPTIYPLKPSDDLNIRWDSYERFLPPR